MSEEKSYTIDEVVDFCSEAEGKLKAYDSIVENQDVIEHNYKMMQLYSPMMSIQSKDFVKNSIENFECTFNKTHILGLMMEDGFGEINWEDLKAVLNRIKTDC